MDIHRGGQLRDPLLDGWRGVSVGLVICSHLIGNRFGDVFDQISFYTIFAARPVDASLLFKNILLRMSQPIGHLGVEIFFIISGYIITALLKKEYEKTGSVCLQAFYIRRVFRILPAFFLFLFSLWGLTSFGFIHVSLSSLLKSGLFLCDIHGADCGWFTAHTWSLAVEEQFYLAWPLIFLIVGPALRTNAATVILIALLCASPLSPISLDFAHIAMGVLIAASDGFKSALVQFARTPFIAMAIAFVLLEPFATMPIADQALGAIHPFAVSLIYLATIQGVGPFVALIRSKSVQKIGLISYSIYLWQQLSTGSSSDFEHVWFLSFPLMFIFPALASYLLVERPFISIGHRISRTISERAGAAATRLLSIAGSRAETDQVCRQQSFSWSALQE